MLGLFSSRHVNISGLTDFLTTPLYRFSGTGIIKFDDKFSPQANFSIDVLRNGKISGDLSFRSSLLMIDGDKGLKTMMISAPNKGHTIDHNTEIVLLCFSDTTFSLQVHLACGNLCEAAKMRVPIIVCYEKSIKLEFSGRKWTLAIH